MKWYVVYRTQDGEIRYDPIVKEAFNEENFLATVNPVEWFLVEVEEGLSFDDDYVDFDTKTIGAKVKEEDREEAFRWFAGYVDSIYEELKSGYTKAERESFSDKYEAAKAFLSKKRNKLYKEIIEEEAKLRGEEPHVFAEKVVKKHETQMRLNALFSGCRKHLEKELMKAKIKQDIEKIKDDVKKKITEVVMEVYVNA